MPATQNAYRLAGLLVLLESVFSLLYGMKKKLKQHASTCIMNKMSISEEIIMTVKLWGVDRLNLHFDYHSESNS